MSILSCIPKLSFVPSFILKIAMKKTLKLGFGRRPQTNYFFLLEFFSQVNIKLHTKHQFSS